MRRAVIFTLVILAPMAGIVSVSYAAGDRGGCRKTALRGGGISPQCSGEVAEAAAATCRSAEGGDSGQRQTCTIMATPTSGPGQFEVNPEAAFTTVDSLGSVPGNPLSLIWSVIVASLPGCYAPSPKELAVAFVTTIPLPKPSPHIAPGYAITGLRAYLETRASEQERFNQLTPLGPLEVITARTSYQVDWGDRTGKDNGPHPYPGLPCGPTGRITHTYTNMGRYDVSVIEQWSATWTLGGESGRITGLQSAPAGIEDFEVTQLQAVRNR